MKNSITSDKSSETISAADSDVWRSAAADVWRSAAADALASAGQLYESRALRSCGKDWQVLFCSVDIDHDPRPVPHTCKLRCCPECERREQFRKLNRYVPAIWDAIMLGTPGYSLKHIVLTTPYSLAAANSPAAYRRAWKSLEMVLNRVFLDILDADGVLSPKERRRGEVSFKEHGIGILVAAEFGEETQHLHFHLLAYCPYVLQKKLTATWLSVTNDEAEVTWIEKVKSEKVQKAINEVTKYVTKFGDLPPALVPRLLEVLSGSRRLRSYGIFNGLGATEKAVCNCSVCGAKMRIMHIMAFINLCMNMNKVLDDTIVTLAEKRALDS